MAVSKVKTLKTKIGGRFMGVVNRDSATDHATTADCPNHLDWCLFRDTSTGDVEIAINNNGTMKYQAITT